MTLNIVFILLYAVVTALLVSTQEITSDSPCRENHGLEDVCWKTGERYAFHCLVHKSNKETYFTVQKPTESQFNIIWYNNRIIIENGEDKYSVETTSMNASFNCISLFISADQSDNGSYYLCGDGQEDQKHARLYMPNFEASIEHGLQGELDVDARRLENISIVATVSQSSRIPGLGLNLYINEDLVFQSPETLSCQTHGTYKLRYYYNATDSAVDYMVIRLTDTHSELTREVQLIPNSPRFKDKNDVLMEKKENMMLTPFGNITIENKDVAIVRITGSVWNVPAEYVFICVDDKLVKSTSHICTDGGIEVVGDFDLTVTKGEIIRIELVYKNQDETEYEMLSTVHFSLHMTSPGIGAPFITVAGVMVLVIVSGLVCVIVISLLRFYFKEKREIQDYNETVKCETLHTSKDGNNSDVNKSNKHAWHRRMACCGAVGNANATISV